jgi:hypothetical protein
VFLENRFKPAIAVVFVRIMPYRRLDNVIDGAVITCRHHRHKVEATLRNKRTLNC